jgi:hypothetical protein
LIAPREGRWASKLQAALHHHAAIEHTPQIGLDAARSARLRRRRTRSTRVKTSAGVLPDPQDANTHLIALLAAEPQHCFATVAYCAPGTGQMAIGCRAFL